MSLKQDITDLRMMRESIEQAITEEDRHAVSRPSGHRHMRLPVALGEAVVHMRAEARVLALLARRR